MPWPSMETKASVAASRMARVFASRSMRVRSASRRCRSARARRTTPTSMTRPRTPATASTVARSSPTLASASRAGTSAVTVQPMPGAPARSPDSVSPSTSIERVTPDRPASASRTRGSDVAETRPSASGALVVRSRQQRAPLVGDRQVERPGPGPGRRRRPAMVSSGYTTARMASTGLDGVTADGPHRHRYRDRQRLPGDRPTGRPRTRRGGRWTSRPGTSPVAEKSTPTISGVDGPDLGQAAGGVGEEGPSAAGRRQLGELGVDRQPRRSWPGRRRPAHRSDAGRVA